MDVEMVARNIRIILAPVVMITACAVLLQGLLGRYNAINDRMRAIARERLELLYDGSATEKYRAERLQPTAAQPGSEADVGAGRLIPTMRCEGEE